MAAPSYRSSSSGQTDAGGTWSFTLAAGAVNGSFLIIQMLQDGATSGAVALTSSTHIFDLAGSAGATYLGAFAVGASSEAIQHIWIGRTDSTGCTIGGTNSTSEDLYVVCHAFDNVSAGTTLGTVIENGSAGATANGTGTSNTAADTGITTLGPDRLALNLIAVNDDNAIATLSGQTGGTWAEAITEYAEASGTDGAIALDIATISSAGTINGGTASVTDSDAWGVVGFALIGTTVAVTGIAKRSHAAIFV